MVATAPRNAPSGVSRAERDGDKERNGVAIRARTTTTDKIAVKTKHWNRRRLSVSGRMRNLQKSAYGPAGGRARKKNERWACGSAEDCPFRSFLCCFPVFQ